MTISDFKCKLCDKKFETRECFESHTSQKNPCSFICNLCGLNFKSKQALEKHMNKKIKCNTITKYQCSKCHKYFTQKHSLVEHASVPCKKYTPIDLVPEPNVKIKLPCNEPDIMDMEFILNQNISTSCKIELLLIRYKKITLSKDAIKSIIECPTMDMKLKINYLKASEENDLNNFGEERLDYLDNNYFIVLFSKYTIEDAYIQLIKDIYLNKNHPQNMTAYIAHIRDNFGYIRKDRKWVYDLKHDLKEKIHEKALNLLRENAFKLKKDIDKSKRNQIAIFLARKFDDDPHLKDVNEKMLLLFYKSNI